MDKQKLAYAISALWGLISIPLSQEIYDEAFDGFAMQIFAFLLVLAPVWAVFGWRWLTDNKPMPTKLWLAGVAVAVLSSVSLLSDRYLDHLALIPIYALAAFLALLWIFEGDNMLWWRKGSTKHVFKKLMPSPTDLKNSVTCLTTLTEELSNEIVQELYRLAPEQIVPAMKLHESDAVRCAYALVYSNLRDHCIEKGSKVTAVLAGYKSIMISSLISVTTPDMPGFDDLTHKEMMKPGFREPTKGLLDIMEAAEATVRDNLARNTTNPFYPFYEGLRPFISGRNTTAKELNETFDSVFLKWNSKAKLGVESCLRQTSI